MFIGERIEQLRAREKISQAHLAKEIGSTRASVNAWEMGLSNPNMQSLLELARYFHVSVDFLLGQSDKEVIQIDSLFPEEKAMILHLVRYFENMHGKEE